MDEQRNQTRKLICEGRSGEGETNSRESKERREEREEERRAKYIDKSMKKWGLDLTEIFIKGTNAKEHCIQLGLEQQLKNGESFNIMRMLVQKNLPKEQILSSN